MPFSACTLDCPGTCSFVVETDGENISINGNPDHPVTKGLICSKGKSLIKRINHPERITVPLLKQDGKFIPVSWDKAYQICVDKITELNPEEILHIRGYGYRGVLANASKIFFRTLGSLETYGSLCDAAGCEAVISNFGSLDQNDLSDLEKADIIVNWGKDLGKSSIHIDAIIKDLRQKGTKVISISPGGDGNEKLSDDTILINPGTDRFLAAAIIKMLIKENAVSELALQNSNGFEKFKAIISKYETDELAAVCGVSLEEINKLKIVYNSDKKVSSLIGWGVQRYTCGGENVRYITALCALSGQLGKQGTGFYYGIPSSRNFAAWSETPETPSEKKVFLLNLENELAARIPKVRFMWIDGINVANQVPDCTTAARAIEECEFVVTVDAFMNDTAARSDLILPCALTLERNELLGSAMHNVISWSGKILEPKGSAKSDFTILRELAARIFKENPIPEEKECLEKAIQTSSITASLDELKENGFLKTSWPDIAYKNFRFSHPDAKMRFPEKLSAEPEMETGFKLLTLIRKNYLHSQIPEEKQTALPSLTISPESPYLNGIKDGDSAMLHTSLGCMKVIISYDKTLHPEAAIIRRGGWMKFGHNANTIIAPLTTDIGNGAAYYSQKAWLESL